MHIPLWSFFDGDPLASLSLIWTDRWISFSIIRWNKCTNDHFNVHTSFIYFLWEFVCFVCWVNQIWQSLIFQGRLRFIQMSKGYTLSVLLLQSKPVFLGIRLFSRRRSQLSSRNFIILTVKADNRIMVIRNCFIWSHTMVSQSSKLYRVSQKFVPLLYKSLFLYDWTC